MKDPVRLVITPYLNTRAFVHHGAPADCELLALPPREAGPAIVGGRAQAGIVPVGALGELGRQVDLLGDYGIACAGPSLSVLFFSRVPFDELDGHSRIALTPDSRSSVRLLYLLLAWRGRAMPTVATAGDTPDGELVIGDAALRRAPRLAAYPYVIDLAERWHRLQGLPMVFARWVIRRDAAPALRARLLAWLAAYAQAESRLLDGAAAADAGRAGLAPGAARAYLNGIRTVLEAADLRGQQRYLDELARFDWPDFTLVARHRPHPTPHAGTGATARLA